MSASTFAIIAIMIVSIFSALATFFLKKAAPKLSTNIKKVIFIKHLWIGLFLYGFATLISLVAYKFGELSVLYPFVALQYVWTALLAKKFLGEKVNTLKIVGIGLIIVGVSLVGLGM